MAKTKVPKNLTLWQKKYGPGFVLYSVKKGEVLASGKNLEKVYKEAEKRDIKRTKDTSIMYLPPYKGVCVFYFPL